MLRISPIFYGKSIRSPTYIYKKKAQVLDLRFVSY